MLAGSMASQPGTALWYAYLLHQNRKATKQRGLYLPGPKHHQNNSRQLLESDKPLSTVSHMQWFPTFTKTAYKESAI